MKNLLILFVLLFSMSTGHAGVIRIAVASNFANTIKDIVTRFEDKTGHQVKISIGSTGKHYAQIKNGAPFDIFFAADTHRPELLDKEGLIVTGSRFTYAQGKLLLWSPQKNLVDNKGLVLKSTDFRYLAVANPKLAPYGKAAQQVLLKRGLWSSLTKRLVRGENIGQTFQFVNSGNAQLGFVAASQVKNGGVVSNGSFWEVPQQEYDVINQQAVLLRDNKVSTAFISFVRSDEILGIIRNAGYHIP